MASGAIDAPYSNVTSLSDFRVNMINLTWLLSNETAQQHHCDYTSRIITSSDGDVNITSPEMLDVGLLTILELLGNDVPSPLRDSTVNEVMVWWNECVTNDLAETQAFLQNVTEICFADACSDTSGIGNADIAGIGVLIANMILALLVFMFWFFGLVHSRGPALRKVAPHRCADSPVCCALKGTIDDIFDATLIYSIALHTATLSFLSQNSTRYDVVYAETSCTFVALAVLTLWHIRGDLARSRFHTKLFFGIMCLMRVAVFVLRVLYYLYPATFWDKVCVPASTEEWGPDRGLMDIMGTICFGISILVTFLPLRRMLRRFRALDTKPEAVSKLRCTQSFSGVSGLLIYILVLKETRSGFEDENSWGIGQFLAISTWVPSLLKMLFILCAGYEKALTNYLPAPWMAVLPNIKAEGENEETQDSVTDSAETNNLALQEEGRCVMEIDGESMSIDPCPQEEGICRRNADPTEQKTLP